MADPREPDPVEQTLLPEGSADEPKVAPDANGIAHELTLAPTSGDGSLCDSELTRVSGFVSFSTSSAELTQVPTGGASATHPGAEATQVGNYYPSNVEVTQVPTSGGSSTGYPSEATRRDVPPGPAAELTQLPDGSSATGGRSDDTQVTDIRVPVARSAEVTQVSGASPVRPASPSTTDNSLTEVDGTAASRTGRTASETEATQVPSTGSRTSPTEKTVVSSKGRPADTEATGTLVGRFSLRGLHARGGLGEVFTARDTELNREVALKRIQSRYADDAASRSRFLAEAQITARLDHPGVVPVFGLVTDGHGRPCYAMRFIRGETLKDEVERYYATTTTPDGRKLLPPEVNGQPRSLAFRHLLQRFIAVCQAIAYAHTRKVIHRDIKPANVMVGTFGETLVVDWGLAKGLDDRPEPEHLMKAAANSDHPDPDATELPSHMTLAGTAVGTPAYMSPEQACGRLDLVGTAADIYSLGATLFVILTGKAPFGGPATETLEKVRRGDFPPPRSVNPAAPLPLDAVCRKAMALNIDDRYPAARDLAADVERWLSDEPVSCYRDPLLARLARWARRHPARVATAVSLLLAGIVATTGTTWAVTILQRQTAEQRKRAEDAERDTKTEMAKVTEEQNRTKEAYEKVKQAKEQTEEQRQVAVAGWKEAASRYEGAVGAFNMLIDDVQLRLADRGGTQEIRRNVLLNAQAGLEKLVAAAEKDAAAERDMGGVGHKSKRTGADKVLVKACLQMGDVYQLLGDSRQAVVQYTRAMTMASEVLSNVQEDKLVADEWAAKQALAKAFQKLGEALLQTGKTGAAEERCKQAIELFEQTLRDDPVSREYLASAYDGYGDVLIELGKTGEASEQCKKAMALRRAIFKERKDDLTARRHLADSIDQEAEILFRAGHTREALDAAAECLSYRKVAYEQQLKQPEVVRELAAAHSRLGQIHLERGDVRAAGLDFSAAQAILKTLLEEDKRSAGAKAALAAVRARLAQVALKTGDLKAAQEHAEAARLLSKALYDDDPDSARAARDLAACEQQIGDVWLASADRAKALEAFENSVALLRPMVQAKESDSILSKQALAHALERLAAGQLADHHAETAVATLRESVKWREEIIKADPASARVRRDLALGLGRLADAVRVSGDSGAALETAARGVGLLRQVVAAEKDSPARLDLARALGEWADVFAEGDRPTAALIVEKMAIDQVRQLAAEDKDDAHLRAELALAGERLAGLYARVGQADPAVQAAHAALTLRTDLANAVGNTLGSRRDMAFSMVRLGDVYFTLAQPIVARKWYDKAKQQVASDAKDAITLDVNRLADERVSELDAVVEVMVDPDRGLAKLPKERRLPTLRAASNCSIKDNQVIVAGEIATRLAAASDLPADRYRAAVILARCAKSTNVTESARQGFALDAVKALKAAIKVGFRDAASLSGPEWDACRNLEEFQQVVKEMAGAK